MCLCGFYQYHCTGSEPFIMSLGIQCVAFNVLFTAHTCTDTYSCASAFSHLFSAQSIFSFVHFFRYVFAVHILIFYNVILQTFLWHLLSLSWSASVSLSVVSPSMSLYDAKLSSIFRFFNCWLSGCCCCCGSSGGRFYYITRIWRA